MLGFFLLIHKIKLMNFKIFKPVFGFSMAVSMHFSAQTEAPKYSYTEAFKPFFYHNSGKKTHSASGQPGHNYGQNSADYLMIASSNDE